MRIATYKCRQPATLAAATTESTQWVPCFGAKAVVFEWKATNANAPQNAGTPVEASNADPLVAGGSTWSGTPGNLANPLPAISGFVLNGAQGGLRCTVVTGNVNVPYIVQEAIRMSVLGHATLPITGLECTAYVIYENDDAAQATGTAAV